ncbi:hypothetical protein [Chengkuizengella axinellae]|uniref:Uncharacterized protein n=1 Tax=Chengkuizengella axinellae TaxID=3064388 RepID=A0ABT9IYX1_9BACL|nr:hypothetical protein [Chengkuizengella sp. 2205SS18-9]MDP5274553.1 hypothetical protein [Chengkuizengella sp. 2205SS18-9]
MKSYFKKFQKKSVPSMNNEIILFLSVGFLAESLIGSGFAKQMELWMSSLFDLSFLLFVFIILLSIIITTFIGIHPLIMVMVLVTQFDPTVFLMKKEIFALLLMVGWSMAVLLSPVTSFNMLVSGTVKEKGTTIGLRWNGGYIGIILITSISYIYVLHLFTT